MFTVFTSLWYKLVKNKITQFLLGLFTIYLIEALDPNRALSADTIPLTFPYVLIIEHE